MKDYTEFCIHKGYVQEISKKHPQGDKKQVVKGISKNMVLRKVLGGWWGR